MEIARINMCPVSSAQAFQWRHYPQEAWDLWNINHQGNANQSQGKYHFQPIRMKM